MTNLELLNLSKQIKALADAGLVFQNNAYDTERYEQLREIALEIQAEMGDVAIEKLKDFYVRETDYPTPKVDVRAFITRENGDFLMVKEAVDNCWTLPGGWADIGLTPSENIIKEVVEETGLEVTVTRLLAVFDKKCHPHPPQTHYVYKLVFLCERKGGVFDPNFDIKGVDWFSIDKLPQLSGDRITESQLQILKDAVTSKNKEVYFD